jgi:hypothetical protein
MQPSSCILFFARWDVMQSGRLINSYTAANTRRKHDAKEKSQSKQARQCRDQWTQRDTWMRLLSMRYRNVREMPTHHIRTTRERLVRLIDRISAQHDSVAADSSLRIHNGVASDHRGATLHAATQVQAAEQHKHMPRQITFRLHRAEDADRIMHLLPRRNIDVFTKVSSITRRLAQRSRGEHKRKK